MSLKSKSKSIHTAHEERLKDLFHGFRKKQEKIKQTKEDIQATSVQQDKEVK